MKKIINMLLSFSALVITLTGCGNVESAPKVTVNTIMDVSQYSRITPEELITKLGEPEGKYENNWTNPSTGQAYKMTSYDYTIDGYYTEFLVIENAVTRMNINTSDNPDNKFKINEYKDVFSLVGIEPRESLIVVDENDNFVKYSSVSDVVGGVWAIMDGNKTIDVMKITYNFKYYE